MKKEQLKEFFANKTVRIVLLCVAALALLLAVWKVFFNAGSSASGYAATEEEARLSTLLEKIDGVEEATVMVSKAEDGTKSVVVVFDGTDGILTRLRITEVVSSAMNIPASSVLVCAVS